MEEYPPSFFELVAQETLSDVVRPALKYILSIAAENYQSIYLRLFNSYDEIYLLLSLAVDSFYLKKYSKFICFSLDFDRGNIR